MAAKRTKDASPAESKWETLNAEEQEGLILIFLATATGIRHTIGENRTAKQSRLAVGYLNAITLQLAGEKRGIQTQSLREAALRRVAEVMESSEVAARFLQCGIKDQDIVLVMPEFMLRDLCNAHERVHQSGDDHEGNGKIPTLADMLNRATKSRKGN